jgi:glycosyltransferase involved in cell wall biosynthesis
MPQLSVVIITKNEEKNIRRCLESVAWADEIVIADSGSTDGTKSICQEFNCRIYDVEWQGFGNTKQQAVSLATNDWILSLDADEVLTPPLQDEIKTLLINEPKLNAYRIKRNSFYLGKMIRFCGWDKDYTLRLFNRQKGGFNSRPVHEFVEVTGEAGKLLNPMLHFTYPDKASHYQKMMLYAQLSSASMFAQGKTASLFDAYLRAVAKLLKMYVLRLGFLDGKSGLLLCLRSAWGVYYKYKLLWLKTKSG